MVQGSRLFAFLAALLSGLVVASAGALAQYSEAGVLNAVSYKPIQAGQTIAVQALDNSDENLVILAEFERVLGEAGYAVQAGAPVVLTFDTEDRIGAWNDTERRTVLELEGSGGAIGRDSARARFNIFDSQRGGIVNPGTGGATGIVTPSRYRLNVSIAERSGERLWQGWATADLQQNSGSALTRAMVPVLVRNIGATVKSESFDLF